MVLGINEARQQWNFSGSSFNRVSNVILPEIIENIFLTRARPGVWATFVRPGGVPPG